MSRPKLSNPNYSSKELGATIVEVSSETAEEVSRASNVLVDPPELFWIAGECPQYVTVRLGHHSSIRYIGWRVCHDYMTNPKVMVISSGNVLSSLTPLAQLTTKPGAGTHMWALPPNMVIPIEHDYVRFEIRETFGGHNVYLNRVFLYEHEPTFFEERVNLQMGNTSLSNPSLGTSTLLTSLLDGLEKDIKKLQPGAKHQPLPVAPPQFHQHVIPIAQPPPPPPPPPRPSMDTSSVLYAQPFNNSGMMDTSTTQFQNQLKRELQELKDEVRTLRIQQQSSRPPTPPPPTHHYISRSTSPVRGGGGGGAATASPTGADSYKFSAMSQRLTDVERQLSSLQSLISQQGKEISELKTSLLRVELQQPQPSSLSHSQQQQQHVPLIVRPQSPRPQLNVFQNHSHNNHNLDTSRESIPGGAPPPIAPLKRYIENLVSEKVSKHERKTERHLKNAVSRLTEDRCGEPVRKVVEGHLASMNPNVAVRTTTTTPASLSGLGSTRRRDPTPPHVLHGGAMVSDDGRSSSYQYHPSHHVASSNDGGGYLQSPQRNTNRRSSSAMY